MCYIEAVRKNRQKERAMNKYMIKVNNATIYTEAYNDYAALKNIGIFKEVGDMIQAFRPDEDERIEAWSWLYEVELNGSITLAWVKRIVSE